MENKFENERLVRLEETVKQIVSTLEKQDKKIENIYDLTSSVKQIATEMKAMREDVNKIDDRVKTIEDKPAKKWDGAMSQIISIIIAGVVGFLLSKIGI